MRLLLICIASAVFLAACKKENLNAGKYFTCHKSQNLDSVAISSKLVGSWKWMVQYCLWERKTTHANKKITVVFRSDSSFSVLENQAVLTQGTWILKPEDGDWSVDLSSPSEYLYGKILFCGNEVLFNKSYVDGCDNLFERN